jgi:hypothetical protein
MAVFRARPATQTGSRGPRALAALLLLLAIAADLAADSRCHPVSRSEVRASVSASAADSGEDACANGCVPDCYCCSVLSATPIFRVPEADLPPVALLCAVDSARAPGVEPVPYRPPLPLVLS